jgi:hypothetical protein
MTRTGILRITGNESRVGGALLSRPGTKDPLSGATRFVKSRGLTHGRRVTVTGDLGQTAEQSGEAVLHLAEIVPVIQKEQGDQLVSKTGILRITGNESRVAGTLLARCGTQSPRSNATNFVKTRGFADGDKVSAVGEMGTIGEPPGVVALCIADISSAGGGSQ